MSTLSVNTIKSLGTGAPVFHNSSGTEKGRLAKAYVNFDGSFSATTFTLDNGGMRTAYNVTSITDNGGNGWDANANFSNRNSTNGNVNLKWT